MFLVVAYVQQQACFWTGSRAFVTQTQHSKNDVIQWRDPMAR